MLDARETFSEQMLTPPLETEEIYDSEDSLERPETPPAQLTPESLPESRHAIRENQERSRSSIRRIHSVIFKKILAFVINESQFL